MRLAILYTMLLAIVGCADPTVSKPVGTRLDQQAMTKLNGAWKTPEGKDFEIKNLESRLFVGFLDFDKTEQRFIAINAECVVTMIGNHRFAFFSQLGDDSEYYFYQVTKLSGDVVAFRSPDPKVFMNGVQEREVEGEMRKISFRSKDYEHAFLKVSDESFLAFLMKKGMEVCFPEAT